MNKHEPASPRTNAMAPSPEYYHRFWSAVLLSLGAILCALVMVYLMSRESQPLLLLALTILSALLGIAATRRFRALSMYFQQLQETASTAEELRPESKLAWHVIVDLCVLGAMVAALASFVGYVLFDVLTGVSGMSATEDFAQWLVVPAVVSVAIGLGIFVLMFITFVRAVRKKKSDKQKDE